MHHVVAAQSKYQGSSSTSVAGSVAAKLDSMWLPDVAVCRRQRTERAAQVHIGLTPAAASLQADLADKHPAAAALLNAAGIPHLGTTLSATTFVHTVVMCAWSDSLNLAEQR